MPPSPTDSGCCGGSRPDAAGDHDRTEASNTTVGRNFRVNGLDCAEEVSILLKEIGPLVGGEAFLAFDVLNARMTVLEGAVEVSDDQILSAIAKTGMSGKVWDDDAAESDHRRHLESQKALTIYSGGFWIAGLLYHVLENWIAGASHVFAGHAGYSAPWFEVLLFLAAVGCGVYLVAPKAMSAIKRFSPDMNLLMMVAVAGAIVIGEFLEAATVAFLFSLSLYLESWSVGRARNAVAALLDLAPPHARVIQGDGTETDMPASEVKTGSLFVVRGGDRVPLDGEVADGAGAINQAPITGESVPVPKEPGDEVYAGTINGEGTLTIRSTKRADDTVLSRIIRMVGDAHARRAPVEQWVTKFARIYTPTVMLIALAIFIIPPLFLSGVWSDWFYNALVLLVIACPCALVISTPVSIVAALASSARQGVLIKGGAYVEAPSKLTALALDKTGTLTKGEPEVVAIHTFDGPSNEDVLAVAAALEVRSSHPLARAVFSRAKAEGKVVPFAEDTQTIPGKGVTGRIGDRFVWLGSLRFAEERLGADRVPVELRHSLDDAGSTLIAVGVDDALIGLVEARDAIRPDAHKVIESLHQLGVQEIVMLTGDNKRTADAVATEVGIDQVHAELLPEDKIAQIEKLTASHDMVAMVGDGVNDAPAMARAHFAIAMGAVGSDAAIETADIALMTDDIAKIPWLIQHSRRAMSVIRQNIGFSLAVKAVFVVLTALGFATMWGAIAADVGASLLVVTNALRLLTPTSV